MYARSLLDPLSTVGSEIETLTERRRLRGIDIEPRVQTTQDALIRVSSELCSAKPVPPVASDPAVRTAESEAGVRTALEAVYDGDSVPSSLRRDAATSDRIDTETGRPSTIRVPLARHGPVAQNWYTLLSFLSEIASTLREGAVRVAERMRVVSETEGKETMDALGEMLTVLETVVERALATQQYVTHYRETIDEAVVEFTEWLSERLSGDDSFRTHGQRREH